MAELLKGGTSAHTSWSKHARDTRSRSLRGRAGCWSVAHWAGSDPAAARVAEPAGGPHTPSVAAERAFKPSTPTKHRDSPAFILPVKKKRDLKNPFIPIITGCHPCTAMSVIPDRAVPSTCFQATRRKKARGKHPKLQHRGTSPALWHPKRRERGAERGPALRHIHTADADGHELQLHLQTPEAHWRG